MTTMKFVKTAFFLIILISVYLTPVIAGSNDLYIGGLKIYVVEPESRYLMSDGNPYHFGFLDYALDTSLLMNTNDTLIRSTTWDASAHSCAGITSDNIMVIAVATTGTPETQYAYPRP